jgi:hypothetical protein
LIDEREAGALRQYFDLFLSGLPMAQAAKEAQLPCSPTTLRNLLKKKEYIGTDYYPAIITEEYQKELIREYEARKGQQVRIAPTHPEKGVRIYKDFHLAKMRTYIPNDPVDCAAALYQRIRPRMKHMETNTPGR